MSSTRQGKNLATTVGANVRTTRNELGLTQREFARLVGGKVDGQRISDWERGAYRPSDISLLRIADVTRREIAWFFTDHSVDGVAA